MNSDNQSLFGDSKKLPTCLIQCKGCKKQFNLKRHQEKCQGVFKCEECDFISLYNHSLKQHGKIRGNMFK